jgi:hypothetical protein
VAAAVATAAAACARGCHGNGHIAFKCGGVGALSRWDMGVGVGGGLRAASFWMEMRAALQYGRVMCGVRGRARLSSFDVPVPVISRGGAVCVRLQVGTGVVAVATECTIRWRWSLTVAEAGMAGGKEGMGG